jgi:LmbE family N-acetylglucosaminyl deacetylase
LPPRLMCLTAHPDDEAGAFGGALLQASQTGARTAVVCLTQGDAGSYREPGQSDAALAEMRRAEFRAACDELQVNEAQLLDYPDGGLWQVPFLELVAVFTEALRRFRPHVVLTFGGEGGVNLHRDHTAVSLAGTAAFHWAGRSGFIPEQLTQNGGNLEIWAAQKLYYAGTPFLSSADEEALQGGTKVPVSLSLDLGPLKERKLAAFRLHTSQRGVLERVQAKFGDIFTLEDYLLVAARTPVDHETTLWDGVTESL